MGENFEKIKRKTLLGAVIKCIVCGVSFGLFAAGAALLIFKLIGIQLAFYLYIAIGAGVALLAGGLAFLIFKPNEKALAKRLDNEYGLQEKTQTALAYAETSGSVIEIQRINADEILGTCLHTGFSLAKVLPQIWHLILIALLSVSIALAGFLLPPNYARGEGQGGGDVVHDVPFELKNEHLDGLEELIESVEDSQFEENLKASIVTLLTRLENNLFTVEMVSEADALVYGTINKIESLILDAYSYVKISTSLATNDQYDFAAILARGVRLYRSYRFVEYSEVKSYMLTCGEELSELVENEEEGLPAVFEAIKRRKKDGKDNTPALIITALLASKVSASDSLYQLFFNLARALSSEDGANEVQFMFQLEDEIKHQTYFRIMRLYILNTLTTLFELPPCADPDFMPEKNNKGDDDGDGKTNEGGYGTGNWKNNLEVYDPRTGLYGKYMEILEDYYALVDEMLRSPDITKEQQKIIDTYFQILFSGQTTDKSEDK